MSRLFNFIASLVERRPFKTLFLTLLIVVAMVAGATQLRLATGNDTLVQTDNPVYISNVEMEETFGGDAILVLFEAENLDPLLEPVFLNELYDVQRRIEDTDHVFSVLSLTSLLHEMTIKQSEMIISTVYDLSDGLNTMGVKMIDLGNELKAKDIKDPSEMLAELSALEDISAKFTELQAGQNALTDGVHTLELALGQTSGGIAEVSVQLATLASAQPDLLPDNSPNVLKVQLNTIAKNLNTTSVGLSTMSTNTQSIQKGTSNTATALRSIEDTLSTKLDSMKADLANALSKDDLLKMADGFIEMGGKLTDISDALEMFYDKSGMMEARIPHTQDELDLLLYEEDELRSLFDDIVVSDHQMMMVVKLDGNLSDSVKDEVTNDVTNILKTINSENIDITISGKSILDSALKTEMKSSMQAMVGMAVGLMFLILLLVFKVKWRLLSLLTIFIAVMATLGFMSWIDVPVTMVSMAVFPILIGLGIDYSIQFHNRYQENQNVKEAMINIAPAVTVAVIATMLGFISLYASPVPMIQDFGKMLTIGVVISLLAAMFILMPILRVGQHHETKVQTQSTETKEGLLERFFAFWTKWTLKLGVIILVLVLAIAAYGFSVDSKIAVETDIETFMPQDLKELEDIRIIRDALASTDQIAVYIEDDNILTNQNLVYLDEIETLLENHFPDEITDVQSITSILKNMDPEIDLSASDSVDAIMDLPENQRKLFVSDNNQAVILISIEHLTIDDLSHLVSSVDKLLSGAPFEYILTGKSVLDVVMVDGLTSGRVEMTLYGLALVFGALLLIYRNLFKAIVPIIPVLIIIGFSSLFMYVYGIAFTPITATLGALILGMGTEMTVMVMERYLEERNSGFDKKDAMIVSIQKIGKAILASGLTTVGGFAVLLMSDFVILQDFGIMTVVNISLALLSTFLVLPPLIVLFDKVLIPKNLKVKKGN